MRKLRFASIIILFLLSGCVEGENSINKEQVADSKEIGSDSEEKEIVEPMKDDTGVGDRQKAILEFINEDVYRVAQYEVVAFQSLASVSGGNYTDDPTVYEELTSNTIPAYEKALEEARSIESDIPELEDMAIQIVTATETFYEALILEKEAIEDQNEELIHESNEKMEEYYKLVEAYHADMQLLAEEYGVTYNMDKPKQNVEEL
ncbi:hypothetical protein [Bacillus sp. KH172YL63]|uniref:hypothetical protein n=1 Tax=Bacillus sp. KH172YL63 TaxID=2709784 RepID=UPI0013E4B44A|nr:hypothetical protein [Bacillus sp. KH172YL63]BCB06049.1 hypothetical protein KH172YL63_41820 [Bacillus sp. KH172YL63]